MFRTLRQQNGLRLLLAIFLSLLLFDRWTVYNTPLAGLDGSWIIAIHLAHQQHLIHGVDFVFTYGPLGWLITRLPIAAPAWAIVAFDILWLLSSFFVLWLAVGARVTLTRVLLLIGLVALHRQCATTEIPFVLYFFVLVYLLYHQQTGRLWALGCAVGLAAFTFYLKANVGLVSLGSVFVYGLWWVREARSRLAGGVAVVTLLILVYGIAQWLPVELGPFLRAQWHMIDSYNDVMYHLQDHRPLLVAVLALLLTGLISVYAFWREWQKRESTRMWLQEGRLFFLVALQLFILFKESFVRADMEHMGLFFKYALLPFGLLILFSHTALIRRLMLVPTLLIGLSAPLLVPYHWDPGLVYRWAPQLVSYAEDIAHPQQIPLTPKPSPWPARWRDEIAKQTVDIMPAEIALLYQHQLSYRPRPVIQTYQVTDSYLDSLNAAHFLSGRAPTYVLLGGGSTDNRDPFTDESLTKLSLLRAYTVADTSGDWILLKRRASPLAWTLTNEQQTTASLRETFSVVNDSTAIQLWQIKARYGLAGYLSRMLFQPPRIDLELTYQTGETKRFRTALPLLRSGLLLSAHPRNQQGTAQWLAMQKVPSADQVRSFRFIISPQAPGMFAPDVRIHRQFYRFKSTNQ